MLLKKALAETVVVVCLLALVVDGKKKKNGGGRRKEKHHGADADETWLQSNSMPDKHGGDRDESIFIDGDVDDEDAHGSGVGGRRTGGRAGGQSDDDSFEDPSGFGVDDEDSEAGSGLESDGGVDGSGDLSLDSFSGPTDDEDKTSKKPHKSRDKIDKNSESNKKKKNGRRKNKKKDEEDDDIQFEIGKEVHAEDDDDDDDDDGSWGSGVGFETDDESGASRVPQPPGGDKVPQTVPPPDETPKPTPGAGGEQDGMAGKRTGSFWDDIFSRPGTLAAVIGGAVVGLLFAVLIIIFIVYRMRKKDEGSYALEETKRIPGGFAYSKAAPPEFYA